MIPWKELENKLAGDAGRSGPGLVGVAAQITDPRVQQMSPGDIQASRRMTLAVSPLTLAPPDNHNVSPPSFDGIWAHSGQGHPKLRRGKKPQEGSDRLASSSSALLLADNVHPRIQIPAIRLSPVIAVYGSVLPGSEKSRPSLYAPTSSSVEGI